LVRNGITTIHDVSFFVGPEWFRLQDRFLLRNTIAGTARRAKAIITVSETSRSEIERFIPIAKGKTRTTALACPPWIQRSDDSSGIEGPFVLTVGTRWPRKNMGLAVEAMSRLSPDLPHRLVVTGKQGWDSNELGDRGIATGYVSEARLSALYSSADLYLAPSRHEGFGLPILEAFRCGCPVLASSGGALPETVGSAGAIEPSWDAALWAGRIEGLLRDAPLRKKMSDSGRAREATFTWEKCAELTASVYRQVAQGL
jgi:glycosyltransferase involved in cell wall biosynthesis